MQQERGLGQGQGRLFPPLGELIVTPFAWQCITIMDAGSHRLSAQTTLAMVTFFAAATVATSVSQGEPGPQLRGEGGGGIAVY